jgi:hypothetical protein
MNQVLRHRWDLNTMRTVLVREAISTQVDTAFSSIAGFS